MPLVPAPTIACATVELLRCLSFPLPPSPISQSSSHAPSVLIPPPPFPTPVGAYAVAKLLRQLSFPHPLTPIPPPSSHTPLTPAPPPLIPSPAGACAIVEIPLTGCIYFLRVSSLHATDRQDYPLPECLSFPQVLQFMPPSPGCKCITCCKIYAPVPLTWTFQSP